MVWGDFIRSVDVTVLSLCLCSIQHAVQEEAKLDCMLKSESVQTATATELQDEWKLSTEGMD